MQTLSVGADLAWRIADMEAGAANSSLLRQSTKFNKSTILIMI
jgi:hypothetical protein